MPPTAAPKAPDDVAGVYIIDIRAPGGDGGGIRERLCETQPKNHMQLDGEDCSLGADLNWSGFTMIRFLPLLRKIGLCQGRTG